jgi:hypothetical protein
MATGAEVLTMLCPLGGWVIYGDDFDSVIWTDERPKCNKIQFTAGFAQYDAWKAEQEAQAATDKAAATAKLAALGLTTDDLKALGLGTN